MTMRQGARRQKHILRLLVTEYCCPPGGTSMSHYERVKALEGDKGQSSHRRRPLESQGWTVIGRTPRGRADYLDLTPEGLDKAAEI